MFYKPKISENICKINYLKHTKMDDKLTINETFITFTNDLLFDGTLHCCPICVELSSRTGFLEANLLTVNKRIK